jgi:hypothetical protein
MPRGKKELAEQATPQHREVKAQGGRGKTVAEAVKKIGMTKQTYSLGCRSSGGCRSTRRGGLRTWRSGSLG